MKERIKTIYESLLIVTGYTRNELNERYAMSSEKRIAQNVLLRMLLQNLSRTEVIGITGSNGNTISNIRSHEPSPIEAILYTIVKSLYAVLMLPQVMVKDFSLGGRAKINHIEKEETVTLHDI